MDKKFSWKNFNLLPKKQQKAVYTIAFSLLGFLLIVVISCILLFSGGKSKPESSSSSGSGSESSSSSDNVEDPFTDDEFAGIKLEEADNTDANYLKETLFIGDSNTERLMEYGIISINNFVGKSGLGISGAATEACVYFKDDNKAYTIPQAVAKMKPRRVVITLGTNDSGESMKTETFLSSYTSFVKAVQDAYPHCDIIINSIPPVAKQRSYKNIDMEKINDFNIALANMAKDNGYKFLNSSEALRDTDGYGKATYFTKNDGIHFVEAGAKKMVDYVRTHPYVAEDRRPDTKNIPTRRPAPSAASSTAPSSSSSEVKSLTATYSVQAESGKAMGYLKSDKFESKTSYTHTFAKNTETFTVTAVANNGYLFDSWSDGVKDAKRTDSNLTESVKLTAKFKKKEALVLKVDKESAINALVGDTVKFTATVTGDGADVNKVLWKFDDVIVEKAAASCSVKFDKEGTFKVSASYEGVENPVVVTITVAKKPDPIVITLTGAETAKVGDGAITYSAAVTGTGADATKVAWTITDEANAVVATNTGASIAYTPTKAGKFKILAALGAVTSTKNLTVSPAPASSTPPPPVSSAPPPPASSTPPEVKILITGPLSSTDGDECSFSASVTGADAAGITWMVGNEAVATGAGFSRKFSANADGSAATYTITAKLGNAQPSVITLTVSPRAPSSTVTTP